MYNYFFEIQNRILYIVLLFSVIFGLNYCYKEALFYFLVKPIFFSINNKTSSYFIYTNITEIFLTYLKISAFTSVYLTLPYLLFQVWKFFLPGMYPSEQAFLNFILFSFTLVWAISSLFSYLILLPYIWFFFSGFDFSSNIYSIPFFFEAKLDEYILFIANVFFSTCFFFQIFFFSFFFLYRHTLSNLKAVRKIRPYLYLLIFTFACLVTPPDILSQLLIAIPFILIYEIIVLYLLVKIQYIKNKKIKI